MPGLARSKAFGLTILSYVSFDKTAFDKMSFNEKSSKVKYPS